MAPFQNPITWYPANQSIIIIRSFIVLLNVVLNEIVIKSRISLRLLHFRETWTRETLEENISDLWNISSEVLKRENVAIIWDSYIRWYTPNVGTRHSASAPLAPITSSSRASRASSSRAASQNHNDTGIFEFVPSYIFTTLYPVWSSDSPRTTSSIALGSSLARVASVISAQTRCTKKCEWEYVHGRLDAFVTVSTCRYKLSWRYSLCLLHTWMTKRA